MVHRTILEFLRGLRYKVSCLMIKMSDDDTGRAMDYKV